MPDCTMPPRLGKPDDANARQAREEISISHDLRNIGLAIAAKLDQANLLAMLYRRLRQNALEYDQDQHE